MSHNGASHIVYVCFLFTYVGTSDVATCVKVNANEFSLQEHFQSDMNYTLCNSRYSCTYETRRVVIFDSLCVTECF